MDSTGVHILRSKLRPPQVRRAIDRARLVDCLTDNEDKQIVIMRAPAGYGKTTLATQYLQVAGARSAWYGLDPSDRSWHAFLAYLGEALRGAASGGTQEEGAQTCVPWLAGLSDPRRGLAGLLSLVEERLDAPAILVLDDYHEVDESAEVRELIGDLLRHLPPNLRVIVASRTTPSLELARLAAAGQVLWLGPSDLEFSAEEVRQFWAAQGGHSGCRDAIRRISEVTHGWAAGLSLFAEWLQRRDGCDDSSVIISGGRQRIYDYLAEEVFNRQPQAIRDFLLDVSVLDEIGVEEAEHIAGVVSPLAFLDKIEQQSVFVRQAGGLSPTYAPHPLFAAFLREKVEHVRGVGARQLAHSRAALFYLQARDLDRSIWHGVSSGDEKLVGRIGEECSESIIRGGRVDLAENLLAVACVPDQVWRHILNAYVKRCRCDYSSALESLYRAGAAGVAHDASMQRLIVAELFQTYVGLQDYTRATDVCIEALKMGDSDDCAWPSRRWFRMNLAFCRTRMGDMVGALQTVEERARDDEPMTAVERAVVASRWALINLCVGRPMDARRHMDRALAIVQEADVQLHAAWVANNSAEVAAELGDYAAALSHARVGRAQSSQSPYYPDDDAITRATMGAILLGDGDIDAAWGLLEAALVEVKKLADQQVEVEVLAGLSTCARTTGLSANALSLARRASGRASKSDVPTALLAHMVLSAALVASDDLDAASTSLREISKTTRKPGFDRPEAWRRFLLAEIARRQGSLKHCDTHLRKSLRLASQNRYVHLMIVEGRISPQLLVRALEADIDTDFACEVLSRIGPWLLPCAEQMLGSGNQRMALLAARVLAGTHRSWARKPLLDAVRSRDPQISRAAAQALASLPVQQEEKLRIISLGGFKVLCGEREVLFRKRKAKHLLEYLFVNRGRKLLRDVVIDAFWPDSAPKAALNNFHVTFHSLKRSLNPHLQRREQLPYFDLDEGCLQLVPETFTSDADEFMESWVAAKSHAAEGRIDDAIDGLRLCNDLYRGDLMEDNLYQDWTIESREELRETYFEAMTLLAELFDGKGDHQAASRILRRLVAKDRTREELHLKVAEQCAKMGNPALAASQMRLCQRALSEDLGVEMSPATRRRFESLLPGGGAPIPNSPA